MMIAVLELSLFVAALAAAIVRFAGRHFARPFSVAAALLSGTAVFQIVSLLLLIPRSAHSWFAAVNAAVYAVAAALLLKAARRTAPVSIRERPTQHASLLAATWAFLGLWFALPIGVAAWKFGGSVFENLPAIYGVTWGVLLVLSGMGQIQNKRSLASLSIHEWLTAPLLLAAALTAIYLFLRAYYEIVAGDEFRTVTGADFALRYFIRSAYAAVRLLLFFAGFELVRRLGGGRFGRIAGWSGILLAVCFASFVLVELVLLSENAESAMTFTSVLGVLHVVFWTGFLGVWSAMPVKDFRDDAVRRASSAAVVVPGEPAEQLWLGVVSTVCGAAICAWQLYEVNQGDRLTVWVVGIIPVPVIVPGVAMLLIGGFLLVVAFARSFKK